MTNTPELVQEMRRLSRLIDNGVQALTDNAVEYAEAEHAYSAAKATAYLGLSEGTVQYRQAKVDDLCGVERRRRNLAEAMKVAALEALRARRAQLSALQSVSKAHLVEMEFARTAPQYTP